MGICRYNETVSPFRKIKEESGLADQRIILSDPFNLSNNRILEIYPLVSPSVSPVDPQHILIMSAQLNSSPLSSVFRAIIFAHGQFFAIRATIFSTSRPKSPVFEALPVFF